MIVATGTGDRQAEKRAAQRIDLFIHNVKLLFDRIVGTRLLLAKHEKRCCHYSLCPPR